MLPLLLAGLSGYLLGSCPTAFLLVHWFSRVDIRQSGSGNVGTLNSYQVTRSKGIGAAVLCFDLLKGVAAVLVARAIGGGQFAATSAGGLGAVLGHNFSVWIRFRGGRGLATGAGVMLVLAPAVVLLWGILWSAGFGALRRVNIANALASLLAAAVLVTVPEGILAPFLAGSANVEEFKIFEVLLFSTILAKHWSPVIEFIREINANPH